MIIDFTYKERIARKCLVTIEQTSKYFKAHYNQMGPQAYNNNYKTICNGIRYLFIFVDMQVIE